jgi:hypothetical protein
MLAIVVLSLATLVSSYTEEAPYEVTKEYDEWEVRKYPATKWISTEARDVMPHDGPEQLEAFYRLFNYIDGSNDVETKIAMTVPVTMRILPGEGPNCESNFTMSFYIPSDMQMTPPQPTDPLVYVEERSEFTVVARRFGGFPTDLMWSAEAAMLYGLASEEGLVVRDVPLWTASYTDISVIVDRRNEVWLEI